VHAVSSPPPPLLLLRSQAQKGSKERGLRTHQRCVSAFGPADAVGDGASNAHCSTHTPSSPRGGLIPTRFSRGCETGWEASPWESTPTRVFANQPHRAARLNCTLGPPRPTPQPLSIRGYVAAGGARRGRTRLDIELSSAMLCQAVVVAVGPTYKRGYRRARIFHGDAGRVTVGWTTYRTGTNRH